MSVISAGLSPNSSTIHRAPDLEKLKSLEARLNKALIDQPEAVHCVSEMIKRIETGFYDDARPRGVLLFAGPTGVGKTELAKVTASELGVPLHRFDMSEFGEKDKVNRLIGSSRGYVDSGMGGELVNKLKETPRCVVLFDEIEKAHPDVYKIFLQLFDEGRLTSGMGDPVIAKEAVFLLTTNLGSTEIMDFLRQSAEQRSWGACVMGGAPKMSELEGRLRRIFVRRFSPELYNRFEKVVVFRNLSRAGIAKIGEKHLSELTKQLARRNLEITWSQKAIIHLSSLRSNSNLGARDIQRKIKDAVLPMLTASRIQGEILDTGVKVHFEMIGGQLQLIVLDKGNVAPKAAAAEQKKVVDSATKENPRSVPAAEAELAFLEDGNPTEFKDGVMYVNLMNKWTPRQLEKTFMMRTGPNKKGENFPHKLIMADLISDKTVYYNYVDKDFKKKSDMCDGAFVDNRWKPVTPADSGWGFLQNLCRIITEQDKKKGEFVQALVYRIFSELKKDVSLSVKPLESLREHCMKENRKDLLPELDVLDKVVGPVTVKIFSKDPQMADDVEPPRSKL